MLVHLCAAILHIPHISRIYVPVNTKKKAAIREGVRLLHGSPHGSGDEREVEEGGGESRDRDSDGKSDGLKHGNLPE